ncbi:MAG: class I SAM-dependent DNA methyltransferase [Minisyncoccota bacterium]
MLKDTEFYNKVSGRYSADRYPTIARSYTQFFFKKRLSLVIDAIKKLTKETDKDLSVLEIGCADGIVLREIYEIFGNRFSCLVGVDTSPKMIEKASAKHRGTPLVFKMRDEYHDTKRYDLVIEVGVINYVPDVGREMAYPHSVLKDGGHYICSLAGTNSLWNKLEQGEKGFNNFLSYEEYETILKKYFIIEKKIPVGFFIPLLWRVPAVARIVQSSAEEILRPLARNLFHENIYLVKRK